jgi:hypothetical protein
MATWTNVPNSVLEPGDPIRSVDIIAIKENVIALSEGATGAPKIQAAALNTGTNEQNWVLGRYAGAQFEVVGSYAVLMSSQRSNIAENATVAGSVLRKNASSTHIVNPSVNPTVIYAPLRRNKGTYNGGGTALSGTWRKMDASPSYTTAPDGYSAPFDQYGYALYLRIS